MNLKNKKGFITIYTMLAMMFFVSFVVVSAITASRKVQIQTEANTELHEIYGAEIVLNERIIPIYTKANFLQIINWLGNDNRETEYIYINNKVYMLDKTRYEDNYINENEEEVDEKGNDYNFILETDIYLDGQPNNSSNNEEDFKNYPYIPKDIHEIYKNKMKAKLDINGHIIYVNVNGNVGNNEIYEEEDIEFN